MPSEAFSYLEDDGLKEMAKDFAEEEKKQKKQIFKSNSFGNGFKPNTSSSGPYMPKELNARHREILRLHALGYKHVEIANMLGCSPQLCSMICNSPLGQDLLSEIHEARTGSVKDVHNRLQEMSPFASEIMLDIMANGDSEANRLRAAEKVLEMTGQKATNKHEHLHAHLTKDEIEELKSNVKGGPPVLDEDDMEVKQLGER